MNRTRMIAALLTSVWFLAFGSSARAASLTATPVTTGNVVTSVSLALDVEESSAYALYVAYGAETAGDDIRSWERYEKVADVTSETTSYVYGEMPAGWGWKYHAIRFFLFETNAAKPFDRALEYVEATGEQYVVTGLKPDGRSVIEADVELTDTTTTRTIFCARAAGGGSPFNLLHTSACYRFDYFTHSDNSALFAGFSTERQFVSCSAAGLVIDGRLQNGPVDAVGTACGNNLVLFALRTSGDKFNYFAKAKLYGFRVWTSDGTTRSLAMDLIPCVKDGNVGFYDRVGGGFLYSATSALVASQGDAFCFSETPAAQSQTFSDAVPVSVEAQLTSETSVTVTFPALSAPCKLFAACGAQDYGADIGNWPEKSFVADLAAGATSQTCAVPEGFGTTSHYLRFFLVDMSHAPCDRQVDSIRGQGAQHIVLNDVQPTGAYSLVADVTAPDTTDTYVIWTAQAAAAPKYPSIIYVYGKTKIRWDYFSDRTEWTVPFSAGRHQVASEANSFAVDGETQATNPTVNNNPFGSPLVLFARHSGLSDFAFYGKFDLHSFKVWRNRTQSNAVGYGQAPLRDLVPCEKDGEAGLYDRMTGAFYGNDGSGSFLTGAETYCPESLAIGGSSSLFAADGRSMKVAKNYQDGKLASVNITFGAAQSDLAYHLYAAFDETDQGKDIGSWARVVYLDPIAATDASYAYTLPAWWGRECHSVRFFLMADAPSAEPMPYDKRLEYIQGSGSAYLQTEFRPTGKSRVSMDCMTVAENAALFSARTSYSFLAFCQPDQSIRFDGVRGGTKYTAAHPAGRYNLVFDGAGAFVDGVQEITAPVQWPSEGPGTNLVLFAYQSTSGEVQSGSKGRHRIYSFRAWQDVRSAPETLGLDLIPCEKGGRPGVYDTVSKAFLPSATPDDFIPGREIPLAPQQVGVTRACGYTPSGMLLLFR